MQKPRQKWEKIMRIAAPAMLALAAFLSLILYQAGSMRRAQENAFTTLRDSVTEQVKTYRIMLNSRFEVLETIAGANAANAIDAPERMTGSLRGAVESTDFSGFLFVDADGNAISDAGDKTNVSDSEFFRASMTGERYIIWKRADATHGSDYFILSVPVWRDNAVCGVLAGTTSKFSMRKMLVAEIYGGSGFSFLCDGSGEILVGTEDASEFAAAGNVLTLLASAETKQSALDQCETDLAHGRMGILSYSIDGRNRCAIYVRVGVNDWSLFSVADGAVVDESVASAMGNGIAITAVIMCIALLFVFWILLLNRRQNRKLAEDSRRIRASEERFRIALANTSVTIWDYDFATKSILQNDQSIARHGFGTVVPNVPESLLTGGYVHPESAAAFQEMYDKLRAGERYAEGVFRVRSVDGSGWWYEHIRYSNLVDEQGVPYRAIGMSEDVTERCEAALAYQRELTIQQVIAPDMLVTALVDITDDRMIRKWFRDERDRAEFTETTYAAFAEHCARRIVEGVPPDDWEDCVDTEQIAKRFARGVHELTYEYRRAMADGTVRWVQDESHLMIDPDTGHLTMFVCLRDVDEEKRSHDALIEAAQRDSMTGLLNHEAVIARIEAAVGECSPQTMHALFVIDIDDFKDVNDRFGHQSGDEVIKEIARLIRSTFRESDIVGRIGGDEFIVLMQNAGALRQVKSKAQELIERLQYTCRRSEGRLDITGSVGVSVCDDADKPFSAYFDEADAALYRAKAAGKNCYAFAHGGEESGEEPARIGGVSSTVQLRTLLENMDGGVVLLEITDAVHVAFVSPSLLKLMQMDGGDRPLESDDILWRVLPEDRKTLMAAVFEAARTESLMDITYRVNWDGRIAWRHIRGALLPAQGDGMQRMIAVVTDVTQLKRSEEQLSFAERRYRTAVEQSKIMLWETDMETGLITHSGELAERMGLANRRFTIEELLASGAIRDDSRAEFSKMFAELLRGSETHEHVIVAVDSSGVDRPLIVRYRLLCDAEGRAHHAVGIAEPLLYDSTELNLYRAMPFSGVFSMRADDAFTLLYGNDSFFRILGYTREEMLRTLSNRFACCVHPADISDVRRAVDEAIASGTGYVGWTGRIICGDGRVCYLQTSGRLAGQPDGSHIINGAIIDVTEQKLGEQALATEKSKLDLALQNASVLTWEYDIVNSRIIRQKNTTWHNAERIVVENVPMGVIETGHIMRDSVDDFLRLCERILGGESSVSADIHLAHAGSRDAWFRCSFHSVFDDDGKPVYAIGFGTDLTEVRAAEARLDRLRTERETIDEDTVGSFWLNLTQNTCTSGRAVSKELLALQQTGTVDGFVAHALRHVADTAGREAFAASFSRESLLSAYAGGQTTLSLEHRYLLSPTCNEWLRTTVNMMADPASGDIVGLIYARSIHGERTMQSVVERLVDVEYEYIALIDLDTERISIISCNGPDVVNVPADGAIYGDVYRELLTGFIVESEYEDALESLSIPWIRNCIAAQETCMLVYAVNDGEGGVLRKRWRFSFLDEEQKALVCTRSDVTNTFLSEVDPVTGVFNRYKLRNEIRDLLDDNPDKQFVLMRIDIDNFKVFNDIYGLEAGDRVLASIAAYLRSKRQPYMRYGHIEADHFACCLPEQTAEKLPVVRQLTEWLKKRNPVFDFTVRVGKYRIQDPAINVSLMSDRALLALKSIKGKYGQHVAFYTEDMRRHLLNEQELVAEMRDALMNGQFIIYLQPQYDYDTGGLTGAETLVRWKHPKKGVLPPSEFISAFEQNGFILQLDRFVWEQACRTLRGMLDRGAGAVPLSVNVSRVDLYDPNIVPTLTGLMQQYAIPAGMLRLEITESAYMENPAQLIGAVQGLRRMGFPVEMDDFGSGYSSLNMLKDVQVDTLKLDMKFLSGTGEAARGGSILSSIIRMARWLSLPVVAEGVETRAQADYLKSIGCSVMQGYYFSMPMPADEFVELARVGGAQARHAGGALELEQAMQLWDASAEATMLFDSFMGGVMILEYARGNVEALRVNDRFLQLLGTTREAYAPWLLHMQDRFMDASRERFIEMLDEAVLSGQEVVCELQSHPFAPEDAAIWTLCQVRLIAHGQDGDILYLHMQNISRSKQDSDALERERQFVQMLYDIAPCGIMEYILKGGEFRLTGCNETVWKLFGYESRETYLAETRQNRIKDTLPEDLPLVQESIRRVLDGERRVDFDHRIVRRDGAVRRVRVVLQRIDSIAGETMLQCVFFDVSDHGETEA